MKTVDIADELYRELDEPTDLSLPVISFWLTANIGKLNNVLAASYAIDPTTLEINPVLGEEEKSIFKKMYLIYFYDRQIRANLGAAALDSTLEVASDGSTVRTINKNELSKTYVQLKKIEIEELNELISSYIANTVAPLQVAGDDSLVTEISSNINYRRV